MHRGEGGIPPWPIFITFFIFTLLLAKKTCTCMVKDIKRILKSQPKLELFILGQLSL